MNRFQYGEMISRVPLTAKNIKNIITVNKKYSHSEFTYGNHQRQKYIVFSGYDNTKPLIYFIHGGGWWHGNPILYSHVGRFFADLGYTVVLPSYRLAKKYTYPTQIEDVFEALKNALENKKLMWNNKDIVVMGFSAGGELAVNIVYNKEMQERYNIPWSKIKGLITLAGVIDFRSCYAEYAKELIKGYLGDKDIDECNPLRLIDGSVNIKTLCIHGDKDPLIDMDNSVSFIQKLRSYGCQGYITLIDNKYHSNLMEIFIGHKNKYAKVITGFIESI